MLVAKLDDLTSVSGTYTVEGENESCRLSSDFHMYTMV